MKIISAIVYYILIFILMFVIGCILSFIAWVIPRGVIGNLFHSNLCNIDSCPTNSLKSQVALEAFAYPLIFGVMFTVFFTRKKLSKIFTQQKILILGLIWLLMLLSSFYTAYITVSFK